jgi:hypothetical protein
MKFIIDPADQVRSTITAKVPGETGYTEQPFTAVIKKLYGDEKSEFIDNLSDKKDSEIIKKLIIDLPDMYDPAGEKLPFTPELLEQISGIDYIAAPLARECVMVQDENMRKVLTEKN